MTHTVKNFIDGKFVSSTCEQTTEVVNPATAELLARTPIGSKEDVDAAVKSAAKAFETWKSIPAGDRIQYFFKFKTILEKHQDELATLIIKEHGKIYSEAMGEVRRAIQMVETAASMPSLAMGKYSNNIARGIDSFSERRPLGVFACVCPFNFPLMVPYWFMPFAVAAGNTYIIKPSEYVPLSQVRIFEFIAEAGFPEGVINMVHGGKTAVDAILTHPEIKGVSFVGSSPVAKYIYETGTAHNKRVQALGGAKNCLVLLPDAPMEKSVRAMVESCYGCAGERCLAGSILIGVGSAYDKMKDLVVRFAKEIIVGDGLDKKVTMGPVISAKAKDRILNDIAAGVKEGAKLVLDGREIKVGNGRGFFIGPTVFDNAKCSDTLMKKEIFGPVIAMIKMETIDEAIEMINSSNYGNTTSLFTSNGAAVRYFISKVKPSMVGINLGVPAPMSTFGFGGSKDSFFGDIKGQMSSVEFFTEEHITMTRWFDDSVQEFTNPHWQS